MAEEAIGLAKSLGWQVCYGPNQPVEPVEPEEVQVEETQEETFGRKIKLEYSTHTVEGERLYDWDKVYVLDTGIKGYYYKGKLIMELSESDSETEDEWANTEVRESLAESSTVRVRRPGSSNFFGSGKVVEIGKFIAENRIDLIFINYSLNASQQKNLEEKWNKVIAEVSKDPFKVTVVDRFAVILRIFSERAKTKESKLQLEIAYLNYIKSRVVRGKNSTILGLLSIFEGPYKK